MSEMVRYQAERVDLADALHDAECECGDRPDHEATDGVDYSNTASTVVSAGWMPAARCEGAESPQAVSDRLFLRQIAGVVDVRTRDEQWQHEVLHRVGVLARADVRQPATEPHRTNASDELRVAAGNLYDFLDMDGVADLLNPASAAELRRRADAVQDAIRATASEPSDLPTTLVSVDDVRRVCEATGLGGYEKPSEGSGCWGIGTVAIVSTISPRPGQFQVYVDQGQDNTIAVFYPDAPAVLLYAAIQAARSAS